PESIAIAGSALLAFLSFPTIPHSVRPIMFSRCRLLAIGLILCVAVAAEGTRESRAGDPADSQGATLVRDKSGVSGRELFLREWIANDPRSHGGDGLGPVFNDTSCVSCHNQGGVGGGGAEAKNVVIITAFLTGQQANGPARVTVTGQEQVAEGDQAKLDRQKRELREELRKLHPGLAVSRSVVLHKSGTDPSYAGWRDHVLALQDVFGKNVMEDNPGAGEAQSGEGFFGTLLRTAEQQKARELQPPKELQVEKLRGVVAQLRPFAFQRNHGNGRLVALPSQRNA